MNIFRVTIKCYELMFRVRIQRIKVFCVTCLCHFFMSHDMSAFVLRFHVSYLMLRFYVTNLCLTFMLQNYVASGIHIPEPWLGKIVVHKCDKRKVSLNKLRYTHSLLRVLEGYKGFQRVVVVF